MLCKTVDPLFTGHTNCFAVLQIWGIQNVAEMLTPQRWTALLSASADGVQQGLFTPADAAFLLGNLCSLSASQVQAEE